MTGEAHPSPHIVSVLTASVRDWTSQAVIAVADQRLDPADQWPMDAVIPEGEGHHEQLPRWLRAVREGSRDRGGYRPRVALVLDVDSD